MPDPSQIAAALDRLGVRFDAMTTKLSDLDESLRQRIHDLRLNLVVMVVALVALLGSLAISGVQYRISADQVERADRESAVRNARGQCVSTINANWQVALGNVVVDSNGGRSAEGLPQLSPEDFAKRFADFRRANDLSRRIPELCYGDEPDTTPLDR